MTTVVHRTPARPRLERLWQNPLPLRYLPLWMALTPASQVYGAALALRERWWGAMGCYAAVPAISVGNLTVGGNGKTPFTLFLARMLREQGIAAGIVSRGWGRRSQQSSAIVSDGERVLLSVYEAGDEPLMMAKSFGGPVAIGRRRAGAIALLEAHMRARGMPLDAVILDDGFQHLRLKRDLNLLLVNAARGFANGWLLPAGPMRDRREAIARADAVVMVDDGQSRPRTLSSADQEALERHPMFHARLEPRTLASAETLPHNPRAPSRWRDHPLALEGRRVVAVSGLADPSGFHAMLGRLGADVIATLAFPDHHDYGPYDMENILDAAHDAELVITTTKDLVKLEYFPLTGLALYALRVEMTMPPADAERLIEMAKAAITRGGARRRTSAN
ncbi:MAG TPA: tetraacyldisaccharide 4'-kinase [Candidatus Binataceae bacterium]|nr:tetraacyldisaccharide 4'-kinase [Candidatus Binataceae bacterium]